MRYTNLGLLLQLNLRDVLALSRVCRRFSKITPPFIYHTVPLECLLDERYAKETLSRRQEHALAHTQRLFIGDGLKHGDTDYGHSRLGDIRHGDATQDDIKRFLTEAKRLQLVEYTYSPGRGEQPICPWKQIYDMGVYLREGNARLCIDNFTPTNPVDGTWTTRGFPPAADISKSLVSLKMGPTHVSRSESGLQILKKLLLRTPLLETFHYVDCRAQRVSGRQFNFEEGQRLPPFKDLMLKNYDWKHDAEEVNSHWDFSQTKSLALLMIPVYNFLQSVRLSDLAQLQHLHAEDYSEATEPQNQKLATKELYALIKDQIRSLQSLNVTCSFQDFHIDALLVHAKSLTSLVFRDHNVSSNLRQHCPVLNVKDLTVLSRSLSSLESLEIDMDHRSFPEDWLLVLCQFPRLHTLVLHTQTVIHHNCYPRPGQDPDLTRAYDCFTMLVSQRPEPTKWRRVVINVGGWRERDVRPWPGKRPGIRPGESYTHYGACVSQRYFALQASKSGEEDLIYEELRPKDEGLIHFIGNLKTGRRFPLRDEKDSES